MMLPVMMLPAAGPALATEGGPLMEVVLPGGPPPCDVVVCVVAGRPAGVVGCGRSSLAELTGRCWWRPADHPGSAPSTGHQHKRFMCSI
jgi:hypothetical protein